MTQSVATRAELLTRMNARTEIFVSKLEDEFRINAGVGLFPDADLRTPVIPGLYFLDLALIYRTVGSLISTNGFQMDFSGPLGITDGGYAIGLLTAGDVATQQRNTAGTGLLTLQTAPIGAGLINRNQYFNRSGWFAPRAPGDLVLNWNSIIVGGAGVTLLRGSSLHLVRAINDGD